MKRRSLAEERPDLLVQWSPENELSPSNVSCGSHKKVWWICEKNHTWEAIVKNRVLAGSGCPYCEHRAVLKGYNDLQTAFPSVAKTWSPKNPIKPSEVSPASNKEVLWVCKNGHEWKARIADRTEGHGCPYCAGHKVWRGFNDLATTHPDLLPEWSDKNESINPETITYKNRTNAWWHCSKCGHEYQAVIYAKANGRICPFCLGTEIKLLRDARIAKKRIAKDFEYLLPQLTVIYYAGQNGLKVIPDSEDPVGIPVTARIPSLNLVIDVCNSDREIRVKELVCKANGIKYVSMPARLPETEVISRVRKVFSDSHIYFETLLTEDLERIRTNYSKWRSK